MGTHCAVVIRCDEHEDFRIRRFERTLDGYNLMDEFRRWASSLSPEDEFINLDKIGFGHLEEDAEGEGEQEYGAIIDYARQQYWFSWSVSREFYELMKGLERKGWTLMEQPQLILRPIDGMIPPVDALTYSLFECLNDPRGGNS